MRSWGVFLLLALGLGGGFVAGEQLSSGGSTPTRWVRQWIERGSAATSAKAPPAAEPAASMPQPAAPPSEGPPAAFEIVTGGETSIIEDVPAAAIAQPIPMYRYFDGSGAIRMVEGLSNVPPEYRHSALEVARSSGRINRVEIPPPSRAAFRDWEPEIDARRGGVILFSAAGCGACARARQHLERLGVPYELRDIHSDSAAEAYVRSVMGRVVVPLLKIGGRHVSGYLPAEYDRLARRG